MPDGATARQLKARAEQPNYVQASPGLLANQPAWLEPMRAAPSSAEWMAVRQHLETRLNALITWRQSWWNQNWSDLSLFLLPRRSIWLTQTSGGRPSPNNMSRGRPINTAITDPTGTYAARVCAAGLMSGLASPSRPWFKMVPAWRKFQLDAAARAWLDETEDRLYTVFAQSNFYNAFAQECEDLVVYGTGPSIMYEDAREILRCYNPAIGEYYLASDSTLRVNTLNRLFVMTAIQMVDFFGLKNCPATVQSAWRQKGSQLEMEHIVAHSIEPNFGIGKDDAGVIEGGFPWREFYWSWGEYGANAIKKATGSMTGAMSQAGFDEQPFTSARWSTQSNDAYGRSPGMDVLPDVMQLQVMTRRLAEAIEKQVRPPLVADMTLKNLPSSTLPGHVTYVPNLQPNSGMRPIYLVEPDIRGMSEWIAAIQNRIKVGLFNDLFLMLEQMPEQKKTAYEVAAKVQEKLQVLGPVIEALITESLKPKLKRAFQIMKRRGLIDPPPASLRGMPLDVEFVSMLALAQKAAATGGLERIAALMGNLAAVYPQITDNLDPDEYFREFNSLLGNPQRIVRGPEQLAQLRQQRQQMQEQQHNAAMADAATKTAGQGAQAAQVLASTPVGPAGNALGMLLGNSQGNA